MYYYYYYYYKQIFKKTLRALNTEKKNFYDTLKESDATITIP